ncbi:UDP-2,3-diacylglucosamine hydrolase [Rubripirellula lacrimiformis]|uniref:UDP-2,3-diacylglucosamine hydrolase n=1 Tax=Rubripirellula lacrimiformis TaxID=1930273 RepID=A0A517N516_9BACT|nr:UDP-2,3-diacylglucosamine diphosphatase [Rubripirellula lacrimiformis]QDT02225.1 UDP-2,3-diacylglucosamine hydrolase [Rubripirellula lacrimiformis]
MDQADAKPVRTLLVSDVHLGCKHSQSKEFLNFLQGFAPENIYLVGDFIDGWKINTGWHWTQDCDNVISHLIELTRRGTKVFYVPGNHDAFLRSSVLRSALPDEFSRVEVANEFVFETLAGWRFLVTHGDLFDCVEMQAQWLSKGTSALYDACLSLNWWLHRYTFAESCNPYGVCAVLKDRVKRSIRFISNFESKILDHARLRDCDGIVCGHIHTPDIVTTDSMWYCNTGDWVENCTGLVECHDGQIQLVRRYDEDIILDLPARQSPDHPLPIAIDPGLVLTEPGFSSAPNFEAAAKEFAV